MKRVAKRLQSDRCKRKRSRAALLAASLAAPSPSPPSSTSSSSPGRSRTAKNKEIVNKSESKAKAEADLMQSKGYEAYKKNAASGGRSVKTKALYIGRFVKSEIRKCQNYINLL